MIKKIIFLSAFVLFIYSINAQNTDSTSISDDVYKSASSSNHSNSYIQNSNSVKERKWRFGGNVSFSFWNNGIDLLIAPKAYYQFSPMFMLGFGLTYMYSDGEYRQYYTDNSSTIYNYHANSIGGSFLILFRPIPFLQISAEFENLHTNWQGGDGFSSIYWDRGLFLGVSYVAGNVAFGLRYNILYDSTTSPYASALSPVVSLYF